MNVMSEAFAHGEKIPKEYTGEGASISPPLAWEGAPEDTAEFAVVCEDPDSPGRESFVHWLVWDIPADVTRLAKGDRGSKLGKNSAGEIGYTGPMPPPGHGVHHYHFKVFALDKNVDLETGASKEELMRSIDGHVLDQGELIGTYERIY
jgi:hypothetical protein